MHIELKICPMLINLVIKSMIEDGIILLNIAMCVAFFLLYDHLWYLTLFFVLIYHVF